MEDFAVSDSNSEKKAILDESVATFSLRSIGVGLNPEGHRREWPELVFTLKEDPVPLGKGVEFETAVVFTIETPTGVKWERFAELRVTVEREAGAPTANVELGVIGPLKREKDQD